MRSFLERPLKKIRLLSLWLINSGIIFIMLLHVSYGRKNTYDIAIQDVDIFETRTKEILHDKTILINEGIITDVVNSNEEYNASIVIKGNNRLVCPGFIDTHTHLSDIFGGYENAPEVLDVDSLTYYQRRLAEEYLDYGVTTIRDAGVSEKWLNVSILLQQLPEPDFPNIYISGAALISDDEREPYPGHVEIKDSSDAREKVIEYYDNEISQIKLYWRLREPELKSIIAVADSLGMNIYGHFDNNVITIPTALSYNVKHFEHVLTVVKSVFDYKKYWNDFKNSFDRNFEELSFGPLTLEIFRYVDSNPALNKEINDLIKEMSVYKVTLSTSIHIFGSFTNRAMFKTQMQVDMKKGKSFNDLTDMQRERLNENFDILMKYCMIAHNKGVRLCIGTDCPNGGKALLSELLLLYEAGFSMEDVLQITTLNGAIAINHDDKYGSILKGKKADLIIFDKNPFENYMNLIGKKTIIKDGVIFKNY